MASNITSVVMRGLDSLRESIEREATTLSRVVATGEHRQMQTRRQRAERARLEEDLEVWQGEMMGLVDRLMEAREQCATLWGRVAAHGGWDGEVGRQELREWLEAGLGDEEGLWGPPAGESDGEVRMNEDVDVGEIGMDQDMAAADDNDIEGAMDIDMDRLPDEAPPAYAAVDPAATVATTTTTTAAADEAMEDAAEAAAIAESLDEEAFGRALEQALEDSAADAIADAMVEVKEEEDDDDTEDDDDDDDDDSKGKGKDKALAGRRQTASRRRRHGDRHLQRPAPSSSSRLSSPHVASSEVDFPPVAIKLEEDEKANGLW